MSERAQRVALLLGFTLLGCTTLAPPKRATDAGAAQDSGRDELDAARDGGAAARDGSVAGRDAGEIARDASAGGRDAGAAGRDAGTSDAPGCTRGKKECAGACIAEGDCCTDDDCPKGASCERGGCQCSKGSHVCGDSCASDSSVASCGQSCAACPAPMHATPSCDGTRCGIDCDKTHKLCGDECIALSACCDSSECPTGAACSASHECACNSNLLGCGSGAALECVSGNCCVAGDCQSSAVCSASHSCDCAPGLLKCGTGTALTCVSGNCCGDGDCPSGVSCSAGICQTWCTQRSRPSGVAASDYQCIDFESGLPASPWTQHVDAQGTLALSSARASSLPSSVLASVEAETNPQADRGGFSWDVVGGTPVTSVTAAVDINPAAFASFASTWSGDIELLCLGNANDHFCLVYTIGSSYVGFEVDQSYTGGIATFEACSVSLALTPNVWTRVELRVSSSTEVNAYFNGTKVTTDCSYKLHADTNLTIDVGLKAAPNTTSGWSVYFDNIEAVVRR